MFCKMCGAEVVEGQRFCDKCGAQIDVSVQPRENSVQQNTGALAMHCPRCGKTNLQVQSNNRILSSMTTARRVGKKHAVGSTAYNSIAETYWFCNSCGMKFRDLDELQTIAKRERNVSKLCKVSLLIMGILFLGIGVTTAADEGFSGFVVYMMIYVILCLLPFGSVWLLAVHDAKKKEKEYHTLLPRVRGQ